MLCCSRKRVDCSPPDVRYTEKGDDDVSTAGESTEDALTNALDDRDTADVTPVNTNDQSTNMDNKYQYDFVVIYNHARSQLCVTQDTKLSLDFANEASMVLQKSGYRGYNPSSDDKCGKTYIEKLCHVLPICHKTIVVFTPEFVRNVLPWYLAIPCLRCHILRNGEADKSRTLIVSLSLESASQHWLPSEINLAELPAVNFAGTDSLRDVEWRTFLTAFSCHKLQPLGVDNSAANTRVGFEESADFGGTLPTLERRSSKVTSDSSKYVNIYGFDAKMATSRSSTTAAEHDEYDVNNNQLLRNLTGGGKLEKTPEIPSYESSGDDSPLEWQHLLANPSFLGVDGPLSEDIQSHNKQYTTDRLGSPNTQSDLAAGHRLQTFDAIVLQAKSAENMAQYGTLGNPNDDCDLYTDLYPDILQSQMRETHRDLSSKRIFSSMDSGSPKAIDFYDDEDAHYDGNYDSDDQFMLLPNRNEIYQSGSVSTSHSSYPSHCVGSTSPISIRSEPVCHSDGHRYSADPFTTQSNCSLYTHRTDSYVEPPDHSIQTYIADSDFQHSQTPRDSYSLFSTPCSSSNLWHSSSSHSPVKRHSSYVGLSARTSTPPPYVSTKYALSKRYSTNSEHRYSMSCSRRSLLPDRRAKFEYPSYTRLSEASKNTQSVSVESLRNVRDRHSSSSSLRYGSPSRAISFIVNRPSRSSPKSEVSSYYTPTARSPYCKSTYSTVSRSIPEMTRQGTFHGTAQVSDRLTSLQRPSSCSSILYNQGIASQRPSSAENMYDNKPKYVEQRRINQGSSNCTSFSPREMSSTLDSSGVCTSFNDSTYSDMSLRLTGLLNENGKRQDRLCHVLHMAETALERRRENEVHAIEEPINSLQKSLSDISGTDELSYGEHSETPHTRSNPRQNDRLSEYIDGSRYPIQQQLRDDSLHMPTFSSADNLYKDALCYVDNSSSHCSRELFDDVPESVLVSDTLYRSTSFIELDMDNVDSSSITTPRPHSSTPRIQVRPSGCGMQSEASGLSETSSASPRRISDPSPLHQDGNQLDISEHGIRQRSVSQPDLFGGTNPEKAIFLLQTIYHVESNEHVDKDSEESIEVAIAKLDTYVPDSNDDASPISPYVMVSLSQANLSLADRCTNGDHRSGVMGVDNSSLDTDTPRSEGISSDFTVICSNDIRIGPVHIDSGDMEDKCIGQGNADEDCIVTESYSRKGVDVFAPDQGIISEDSATAICFPKPRIDLDNFTYLPTNEDYISPSVSHKQENAFSHFAPCSDNKCADTRELYSPPPVVALPVVTNIGCEHTTDRKSNIFRLVANSKGDSDILRDNAIQLAEECLTPIYRQKPDIRISKFDIFTAVQDVMLASKQERSGLGLGKIAYTDVSDDFVIPDRISKRKSIFDLSYEEPIMGKPSRIDDHCPKAELLPQTVSGERYVDRKELVISSLPPETFRMENKPNIVDISTTMDNSFDPNLSISYATIVLHSTPKGQIASTDYAEQTPIENIPDTIGRLNFSYRKAIVPMAIGNQDENVLDNKFNPMAGCDLYHKDRVSNRCTDITKSSDPVTCENRSQEMTVPTKDHRISPSTVEDDSGCYSILDSDCSIFNRDVYTNSPGSVFNENRIPPVSTKRSDHDPPTDFNETIHSYIDQNSTVAKNVNPCVNDSSFVRFPYEPDSGIHCDSSSVVNQDEHASGISPDFQSAISLFRGLEKSNSSQACVNDRVVTSSLRTRLPGYKCHYFQYLNSFVGHSLHSIPDQPDGEREGHADIGHENVSEQVQTTTSKALPRIAVQQYLDRTYANFNVDDNQYSGWISPARPTRHQRSLSDVQVSVSPRIPVRPRPQSASCVRRRSSSDLHSLVTSPVTKDTVCRVVCHLATHPEHMYM